MRTLKAGMTLALVVMTVSACSLLNPPQPSTTGNPLQTMYTANQELRGRMERALGQAAESLRVSVRKDNIVFVSRDDLAVAHALVSGFDTLRLTEPDRIADVGLVYLQLPTKTRIPQGFYKVRIFTLEAKSQLLDANGQAVAVLPLEKADDLPSSRPQIEVTGCRVTLIYQQAQQPLGPPPIQAAVPIDWCERGL